MRGGKSLPPRGRWPAASPPPLLHRKFPRTARLGIGPTLGRSSAIHSGASWLHRIRPLGARRVAADSMSDTTHSRVAIPARVALLAVALACAAQLLQLPQWRETYLLPGWLGLCAAFAAAAAGLA